jgi:hypothetical protein
LTEVWPEAVSYEAFSVDRIDRYIADITVMSPPFSRIKCPKIRNL